MGEEAAADEVSNLEMVVPKERSTRGCARVDKVLRIHNWLLAGMISLIRAVEDEADAVGKICVWTSLSEMAQPSLAGGYGGCF